jgi:RNA polymerase sigma-70 factor (ECF subfamily)
MMTMTDDRQGDPAEVFAANRPTLVGVAYRMLGQVADAEDVVQDAWLRWADVAHDEIRDPTAFLVRITSRLALDRMRRVKARRESYAGEWLPQPIPTGGDLADNAALADTVSMAMLIVLETLSPLERAVFVLREAFGHSHAEIAEMLDRS